MATVFANGRSITHKGDGQTNIAAPPDVCKTPSPGGPIPIPYVNIARTSDLAKGSKKVKVEGNPAALKSSNLSTSTGDEPGTAGGGIISSKTKGKLTWATSSPDVKIEGKNVVRFMDVAQHNGNSFNTAFMEMGETGLAYGDDFEGKCPICKEGPEEHRVHSMDQSVTECAELIKALKAADKRAIATGGTRAAKPKYTGNVITSYGGYMVGVMICKCGEKFAAMSGRSTWEGFESVVNAGDWKLVSGGQIRRQEWALANRHAQPDFTGKSGEARAAEASRSGRAKRAAASALKDINKTNPNPKVGVCAAAKLTARSPAKDHVPASLTEMYFGSEEDSWERTYEVLTKDPGDADSNPRSNEGAARKEHKFQPSKDAPDKADAVASCSTCQQVMPLTTCKVNEKSC